MAYKNRPGSGVKVAVLDAPSNLGLRPPKRGVEPGCKGLASALRVNHIVSRLSAIDAGAVVPPPYSPDWDGRTTRNAAAIFGYSRKLADRVYDLLDEGLFPVVLGGDCSILLGNALALRKRGRFGLAFLDGHLDFRHPGNTTAMSAAAGEDLALVTGRGSPGLTDFDGLHPLMRDTDVVALGDREDDPRTSDILETEITIINLSEVNERGIAEVARDTVETLAGLDADGFWIHLDADILDDEVMPAVDSPQPSGLSYEELTVLLKVLLGSELATGIEITVFDPDLDPDGTLAAAFTDCLVASFADAPE